MPSDSYIGAPTTTTSAHRLETNVAVNGTNGHEVHEDCAGLGMTCSVIGGRDYPHAQCMGADSITPTCTDGILTITTPTKTFETTCAKLGIAWCEDGHCTS